MRPADLPSTAEIARTKPHGHFMRYVAGCRCRRCKQGRKDYESKLDENRRLYGPNDFVSTDRVREHLLNLQKQGLGHKLVAKAAGVGKTGLAEILWYGKKKMGRRAERKVLAVRATVETLGRRAMQPAGETVEYIQRLLQWGYPKRLISAGIGQDGVALQIPALKGKAQSVHVKTAVAVRELFRMVKIIRRMWSAVHGPIPSGHYVWLKRGDAVALGNLKLQPFAVNHEYFHFYPRELREVIDAANQLKRQLRKHGKEENAKKQNERPEEPPVRNPGESERPGQASGHCAGKSSLRGCPNHHQQRNRGSKSHERDGERNPAQVLRRGAGKVPASRRRIRVA